MYKAIFYIHLFSVVSFLLIYLVKTIMLLMNNTRLDDFTRKIKVPEMIISFAFLGTGIYMLFQVPEINRLMIIKLCLVVISIPIAVIGFKRRNKLFAVLSLLLIIGAYGLAEISKKRMSKPVVEVASTENNGQELYTAYCTRCHGDDGKLGLMGSKDLSVSSLDNNGMKQIISNGRGAMNGFSGQLTNEQIDAVILHIEKLKGK